MNAMQSNRRWSWKTILLVAVAGGLCMAKGHGAAAAEPAPIHAYGAASTRDQSGQAVVGKPAIVDVAIQSDGVLRGRILDTQGGTPAEAKAGLPISFVRDQKLVARAISDDAGRFAIPGLSGGIYQVILEHPLVPRWQFCRLWSSEGAPPQASREMALILDPVVVRGRAGLWLGWPPSFTATALTAGAISAPIIYHNVHRDNAVPMSP